MNTNHPEFWSYIFWWVKKEKDAELLFVKENYVNKEPQIIFSFEKPGEEHFNQMIKLTPPVIRQIDIRYLLIVYSEVTTSSVIQSKT